MPEVGDVGRSGPVQCLLLKPGAHDPGGWRWNAGGRDFREIGAVENTIICSTFFVLT